MERLVVSCFLLFGSFIIHVQVSCETVGIVFSPLVRKTDRHNTQSYIKDMIKTMINVIVDGGFNAVTTYGVGSPNLPYDNSTFSKCSSFVHTARAIAEVNRDRKQLAVTLYQGIYNSTYEDQVNCEIEVALETARQANVIYNGSVFAIVYPSKIEFNELIDNKFISEKMEYVSKRVRDELKLEFGVRIMDCQNVPTRTWEKVKGVVENLDFIICSVTPDESKFKFGYSNFKNYAELMLLQTEDYLYLHNPVNDSDSIDIILETGWPGDPKLKHPNSVEDEQKYWQEIKDWGRTSKRSLFMTEAFDSPWKEEHPEWPLAAFFGKWRYNPEHPDLLQSQAFILKQDLVPSFLRNLFGEYGFTMLGVVGGLVTLAVVTTLVILLFKRVKHIEQVAAKLSHQDVNAFLHGWDDNDGEYVGNEWEKSPYDRGLELNQDRLKIDKSKDGLLGKGQFGCVYRGQYKTREGDVVEVAVKMSRSQCSSQLELKSILSEIKILTYLGTNRYVCGIVGCVTDELSQGIVYLATEFCALGSLEQYLRSNQEKFKNDLKGLPCDSTYVSSKYGAEVIPLSEFQLFRWSLEIASAMEYISSKNVIHSDLATRNILLTLEYSTKVTDFGLSRRLLEAEDLYSKVGSEPLPWKWLSPESLEFRQFSTKSDVFTFGITLWELWEVGGSPTYENARNWNELLAALKEGKRLKKPEYAGDAIYSILLQCWELEPTSRPGFSVIVKALVALIDGEYTDMNEA